MSRDLDTLYDLTDRQFKVIESDIAFMKSTVKDLATLIDESYLMKKDAFELTILMRAIRDMILDELEQARYARNNGDMV